MEEKELLQNRTAHIKELIKREGISQRVLAEKIGRNPVNISRDFRNNKVSLGTCNKIKEVYPKYNLEWLQGYDFCRTESEKRDKKESGSDFWENFKKEMLGNTKVTIINKLQGVYTRLNKAIQEKEAVEKFVSKSLYERDTEYYNSMIACLCLAVLDKKISEDMKTKESFIDIDSEGVKYTGVDETLREVIKAINPEFETYKMKVSKCRIRLEGNGKVILVKREKEPEKEMKA